MVRRRLPLLCAGLVLLIQLVGCLPPPAGKLHAVGDHRLRSMIRGTGSPTVVFDSGLGDSLETWHWVWRDVAAETRVFLYDRAGLGRSEPGPAPRTSRQCVDELDRLLDAAGVEPPYVLVGHSLGGLNLRLFAIEHPAEVVGLVLVDATPVDFPEREAAMRTEEDRIRLETAMALGPEARRQELESAIESARQVRQAGSLPEIPVIVLTSTRPEESDDFRRLWASLQDSMAESLSAERHTVTSGSGHYIQFDQPGLVVDATLELVRRARGNGQGGDDSTAASSAARKNR